MPEADLCQDVGRGEPAGTESMPWSGTVGGTTSTASTSTATGFRFEQLDSDERCRDQFELQFGVQCGQRRVKLGAQRGDQIRWPAQATSSASSGAAVSTSQEKMVPLAAFSHYQRGNTPLAVNHQGPFVPPRSRSMSRRESVERRRRRYTKAVQEIRMAASVHGKLSRAPRRPSSSRSTANRSWCCRPWSRLHRAWRAV